MSANRRDSYDAVIVGAGPNGLAAAITLAQAGRSVLIVEGSDTIGGGARSAELTLPGFLHDVCSAIHPLAMASPFFRSLPLADHGLRWVHPDIPAAHPLDGGRAVAIERSLAATADHLGRDGAAYRRLMGPFVRNYQKLLHDFLGPLRVPRYPVMMARFGLPALLPAVTLARLAFRDEAARAVFGGMSAHSIMALEKPGTAAFGIMLDMLAHSVGWPLPVGGAQQIADALVSYLHTLDGEIVTRQWVESVDDLPPAKTILLDVTPRQLVDLAGHRLPGSYKEKLSRYRHGPGVFKMDFALDGPIPWQNDACRQAGTVHVGGTLEEIAQSEHDAFYGQENERPFVLVGQQSLFDASRAPEGQHTVWAYCHVPNGSTRDMSDRIEAQIERYAPGFRSHILAKHCFSTDALERYNPNYIGGDINGGVQDLTQLFTRPVLRLSPYSTPDPQVWLCSSSTPPGGGVHGMCGYFAAQAVLRRTGS